MFRSILTLLFSCFFVWVEAQRVIPLENHSFEGPSDVQNPPPGWTDCGFASETPASTLASENAFGVMVRPFHGETCLAMVARDNGTFESVGQVLPEPLEPGRCYRFSVRLSRPSLFLNYSRATSELANYNTPLALSISGGQELCSSEVLLALSPVVQDTAWQEYTFVFQPVQQVKALQLSAFWSSKRVGYYNGALFVDSISDIEEVECDSLITLQEAASLVISPYYVRYAGQPYAGDPYVRGVPWGKSPEEYLSEVCPVLEFVENAAILPDSALQVLRNLGWLVFIADEQVVVNVLPSGNSKLDKERAKYLRRLTSQWDKSGGSVLNCPGGDCGTSSIDPIEYFLVHRYKKNKPLECPCQTQNLALEVQAR
ncbi:MAG: hypothetical protein D6765_04845 [Bacteroidetes bacterium]|nr:MAG: hypothetical protein D6765_04845 [Bacteroidota bacterium]